MPQAQYKGKSIPKVVRVNADDSKAVLYKNLGDGQRVPFMWTTSITLASGTTSSVVASGVAFSGFKAADGQIFAAPTNATAAATSYYIEKDTLNNVVTLKDGAAGASYDIFVSLGTGVTFASTDTNQIWKR